MLLREKNAFFVTGFCGQYITVVLTQNLTFFADETLFRLSGSVSAQDSRYWDRIDSKQTFEDVTIGVCGVT
jgi:hypothetical protein